MLLINCPCCGPRDEFEFRYGGPAHVSRPEPPEQVTDQEWGNYLFTRLNPKGISLERWVHAAGCRQWFNIARSTVTHEIKAIYPMGKSAPSLVTEERPAAVVGLGLAS
jgi:heterotetrameric sarcosine oxidase delta subunit